MCKVVQLSRALKRNKASNTFKYYSPKLRSPKHIVFGTALAERHLSKRDNARFVALDRFYKIMIDFIR